MMYSAWQSFTRSVIVACTAALFATGCVGQGPGDGVERIVFAGSIRVAYAEAEAYCRNEGATLVDVQDVGVQAVYDAWVEAETPSDGVWVAMTIVNTEGTEYGYAMTRGGALLPVEMSDTRTALPVCEVRP